MNKYINYYGKFRKLITGNSIEDIHNPKESVFEMIKRKKIFFAIVISLLLFVNWKMVIAIIGTICFGIFLNKFINNAKKTLREVENENK